MVKYLTPIGNSFGLIIDRPILNLLQIDRDTELEVSTDGKSLTIRPIREYEEPAPKENNAGKSFLAEFREALK
ncbi:MAG: AbrB/MazE/SpoVT family DNA-binding domain-containing protein [Mariprofundaceae bacterium]